jgi:amino acid transporter
MQFTSGFNILATLIEASGLLLVLIAGTVFLAQMGPPSISEATTATGEGKTIRMPAILKASVLAFFVFIGFEDMCKVAEEVENPKRTLPAAILTAVGVTGVVYLLVIRVATQVVSPETLGQSDAPLLEVIRVAPAVPPILFTAVAIAATGLGTALFRLLRH